MNFQDSDLGLEDRLSSNAFLFLSIVFANQRLEQIFSNKFRSKDHFLQMLDLGQYNQLLVSLFELMNAFFLQDKPALKKDSPKEEPKIINNQAQYFFTNSAYKNTLLSSQRKSELEQSIREIIQKDFQPLKRQISQPRNNSVQVSVADSPMKQFEKQLINEQSINRFSFGIGKDDIIRRQQTGPVTLKQTPQEQREQPTLLKSETPRQKEQFASVVMKSPPKSPKSAVSNRSRSQSPSNQDSRNYVPIDEMTKKKKAVVNPRNFNILTNEDVN